MLGVPTVVTETDIGDSGGDVISLIDVKTVETSRDGGTDNSAQNEPDQQCEDSFG
jgi:hypothetical protein